MAFISKNPSKARYLIRSKKTCGTKMVEMCDNKVQVAKYLKRVKGEKRTDIGLWARTTESAFKGAH